MPAAQPLRVPAPGGAPDAAGAPLKETPHLVLVTAVPVETHEPSAPADVRRQSFGQRLRAARERRGITLHEIAETTKVSVSLLAALERNDVSRWPKGIFRRSFFREYVSAIGLPAEPLGAEFLQLFPDGEHHAGATPAAAAPAPAALRLTFAPAPGVPQERMRAASLEALVVLTVAVAAAWWTEGGPLAGVGVIALCYYHRLLVGIRRRWQWRHPFSASRSCRGSALQENVAPGLQENVAAGLQAR